MPRPPHLNREVTRHGKVLWYVRIDKGPRIRVADYGTPEFEASYQKAQRVMVGPPEPSQGPERWPGSLLAIEKQTHGQLSHWQPGANGRTSFAR